MTGGKAYLGDGVYVDFDAERRAIVLTAENGIEATDTIYLERDVYEALALYADRIFDPLPPVGEGPLAPEPEDD